MALHCLGLRVRKGYLLCTYITCACVLGRVGAKSSSKECLEAVAQLEVKQDSHDHDGVYLCSYQNEL